MNSVHHILKLGAAQIPSKLCFVLTVHCYLVTKRVKLLMQTNTKMNPQRVTQDEDHKPSNAMCA